MADTDPGASTPSAGSPDLTAPDTGAGRKRQSSTSRFIIGCVLLVIGAELLTFGWQYVNVQFKLHLDQPVVGSQMAWLTWFFLINATSIVGLWTALNMFGFFPRDSWAPRSGALTRSAAATTTQARTPASDDTLTFRSDEHG